MGFVVRTQCCVGHGMTQHSAAVFHLLRRFFPLSAHICRCFVLSSPLFPSSGPVCGSVRPTLDVGEWASGGLLLSAVFLRCPSPSPLRPSVDGAHAGAMVLPQIHYMLLISRQGKIRLSKWYSTYTPKEKQRITREVSALVLNRAPKMCNFIEYKEQKIVYKRCVELCGVRRWGEGDTCVPRRRCGRR